MRENLISFTVILIVFLGACALAWYTGISTRAVNNKHKAEDYELKARLFRQKGPTFYRVADSLEVLTEYYWYKAAEDTKDLPKWLRE